MEGAYDSQTISKPKNFPVAFQLPSLDTELAITSLDNTACLLCANKLRQKLSKQGKNLIKALC